MDKTAIATSAARSAALVIEKFDSSPLSTTQAATIAGPQTTAQYNRTIMIRSMAISRVGNFPFGGIAFPGEIRYFSMRSHTSGSSKIIDKLQGHGKNVYYLFISGRQQTKQ